jgi:hypothetical protein
MRRFGFVIAIWVEMIIRRSYGVIDENAMSNPPLHFCLLFTDWRWWSKQSTW